MTNQGSQQWFVIVPQDSNIGAKKGAKPLPAAQVLPSAENAGGCCLPATRGIA